MYIILLKVYCSLFSAIAAGTIDRLMIDLLWKTRMNFQVQPIKKKGKHGSVEVHNGKLVHSIWKEYGNYNISLLMPE